MRDDEPDDFDPEARDQREIGREMVDHYCILSPEISSSLFKHSAIRGMNRVIEEPLCRS